MYKVVVLMLLLGSSAQDTDWFTLSTGQWRCGQIGSLFLNKLLIHLLKKDYLTVLSYAS